MKTLALLLTSTQLCAFDLDGWYNCGATGKYVRFKFDQFALDNGTTPKEDINHIHLNSVGVEAEVGLIFPSPFFIAIEGAYTRIYSGKFLNKSIKQESVSSLPPIGLGGEFYSYDVKGCYLFQPLCNIPWGLYPLFAYNSDSIHAKLLSFPGGPGPGVEINLFHFRPHVTLRGPALGFGTTFNLPYGISIQAEGSWQWRQTTISSNNQYRLTEPGIVTVFARQISGTQLWAQGPKVDLYLEYTYYNWFIGVGGEWQHLKQLGESDGVDQELQLATSLQNQRQQRQSFISPMTDKNFGWTNWNWKATIGYTF